MKMPRVIAITYEGGAHCQTCAAKRFGPALYGDEEITDVEGNVPGVIFETTEWYDLRGERNQVLACEDCGEVLDEIELDPALPDHNTNIIRLAPVTNASGLDLGA